MSEKHKKWVFFFKQSGFSHKKYYLETAGFTGFLVKCDLCIYIVGWGALTYSLKFVRKWSPIFCAARPFV